jgi:hypothetical protein
VAGQRIGKSSGKNSVSMLTVRFENGDMRTDGLDSGAEFRLGDRKMITGTGANTSVTR